MRYRHASGFTYPVLSPASDDYPEGKLTTAVKRPELTNGQLRITIDFSINEPYLATLVRQGAAYCAAMLYCRSTLYQNTLRAACGSTRISSLVPRDCLSKIVELHPLLVAADRILLDTATAGDFYHDCLVTVTEGAPLANDEFWDFALESEMIPLGSIFQFTSDPAITGPSTIDPDPDETYIDIRIQPSQLAEIQHAGEQELTLPSILTAALIRAIYTIRELDQDADPISPGWVDTIAKQARQIGLDLTEEDPFVSSQRLLDNPFASLKHFERRDQSEDDE